jgi:hypothetical protein
VATDLEARQRKSSVYHTPSAQSSIGDVEQVSKHKRRISFCTAGCELQLHTDGFEALNSAGTTVEIAKNETGIKAKSFIKKIWSMRTHGTSASKSQLNAQTTCYLPDTPITFFA